MYFLLLRSLAPDPQEQPQLSPSRHALALVADSPTPLLQPHSTSDNTTTTAITTAANTTAANTTASASGDADTVTASASQQQQRQQQLRDCVRPFWDTEHSGALLQPALDLDGRGRSWCKRFSTKAAAGAGEADMTAGTFGVTIRVCVYVIIH
jgi:cytoskeletal protein RodZ